MKELFTCSFKCYRNDEPMNLRSQYGKLYYDELKDWLVFQLGKKPKSSYKVSNITDVQMATWGSFARHISVAVFVTDDDGVNWEFVYESPRAQELYPVIIEKALATSPAMQARKALADFLNRSDKVSLLDVLDRLSPKLRKGGLDTARAEVEHLIETGLVVGKLEGDEFERTGVAPPAWET
jgi:hypothetical protein